MPTVVTHHHVSLFERYWPLAVAIWLLLIAFGFSILQVPATILELTGVLPNPIPVPLWYSLSRTGVALVEVGIAVWMVQIYRQYGVWAMGKRMRQ